MQPVRIGLVGYGFGGRFFHAPLIAAAAGCEFIGLVTTSAERKQQFSERYDGRATYATVEALVADGAEALAISTPVATHVELVQRALGLGLAVVCDKPFTLDAPAARETVLLAEQLGRPLTVYQNRRWDSDFLTVRRAIADGLLGEPVRFESRFERFSPDPGPSPSGGGALRDFGSHLVDQALILFGPVTSAYAELHTPDRADALDDEAFLALTHAGGGVSHITGSWRQSAPGPRFRVTGTTASYVVSAAMDSQEGWLVNGESPATRVDWGVEPEERWGRLYHDGRSEPLASERGAWDRFYQAFAEAVRGVRPVPVDPWDAVGTATVIDAARESAASGRVIAVEPVTR